MGRARQRRVRMVIGGAGTAMGAHTAMEGAHGGRARPRGRAWPRGAYACTPNDGRGLMPRGWRGAHTSATIIGARTGGAHASKRGGYICLALLI
jgi:hypothetical protein